MAAVSISLSQFRLMLDAEMRKQAKGNVLSDDMFNVFINAAQSEYMDNQKKKAEITSDITGVLKPFYEEIQGAAVVGGKYALTNYAKLLRVSTLYNGNYVPCDVITALEYQNIEDNTLTAPTLRYPCVEEMGSYLQFYPSGITTAKIKYIREPNEAFLDYYFNAKGITVYLAEGSTYTLLSGEEYRDGTTSGTVSSQTQEFEWGVPDIMGIFDIVMRYASVPLERNMAFSLSNREVDKKENSL